MWAYCENVWAHVWKTYIDFHLRYLQHMNLLPKLSHAWAVSKIQHFPYKSVSGESSFWIFVQGSASLHCAQDMHCRLLRNAQFVMWAMHSWFCWISASRRDCNRIIVCCREILVICLLLVVLIVFFAGFFNSINYFGVFLRSGLLNASVSTNESG